jgi:hypothetical protein
LLHAWGYMNADDLNILISKTVSCTSFQLTLPQEVEAALDFLELCINLLWKDYAAKYASD